MFHLLVFIEAVYFAKPIVGIPFFADQHLNMFLAEQKGFAVNVPIESLTDEILFAAVNEVTQNPRQMRKFLFEGDLLLNQV